MNQVFLKERLEEFIKVKPDVVGISLLNENYHIAIDWAEIIKEKLNVSINIGGVHIFLVPISMVSVFDVAVIGEGEYTLVDCLI